MRWGEALRAWLPAGGFGETLYVFDTIDSTNTFAAGLARAGAGHGTLVVADQQTRGRGRGGARWETRAGAAIALSILLRPAGGETLRWSGLGALAVLEGLRQEGLSARIKWPNDVLLGGRKVAGVLAEAAWEGDQLSSMVLGVGVNVGEGSVPAERLAFPATHVEEHARRAIDRAGLTAAIVRSVASWAPKVSSAEFLRAWEKSLAYRGDLVRVDAAGEVLQGRLLGLGPNGEARLLLPEAGEKLCGGEAKWLRPLGA